MQRISSIIRLDKEFCSFTETLQGSYGDSVALPIVVNGLSGGAEDAFLIESVIEAYRVNGGKPVLILTDSDEHRDGINSLLVSAGVKALRFKSRDFVFKNISASADVDRERLSVLHSVLNGECEAVVASAASAVSFTMPAEVLERSSLSLSVGDEIEPSFLSGKLSALGFSRVDAVESKGQFSLRGGIVDFWGGEADSPIRVEFFGDEVDRMVCFDPLTQRSTDRVDKVLLLPAKEIIVDSEARERIIDMLRSLLEKRGISEALRERLKNELSVAEADLGIDCRDKYLGLIYRTEATLFSYFERYGRTITFLVGTRGTLESAKKRIELVNKERDGMLSLGVVSESAARYTVSEKELEKFLSDNLTVHINPFAGGVGNIKLSGLFGFRCRRTVSYGGNPSMLSCDLSSLRKGSYKTVILCDNGQGADSLCQTLGEEGISAAAIHDIAALDLEGAPAGAIFATVGSFDGFDLPGPRVALLSMARDRGTAVLANKRRQRIMKRAGGSTERIMSYQDLKAGDYVVHANYGIGLFEGVEAVTVGGVTKDYITIRYAGTDKLFVPCDRLEMIGKYIGQRDKNGTVKLSRMGGGEWARAKTKTRAAVLDIAKDLIRLYAERQSRPGFAFQEDGELELDFAGDFQYEETDSQLAAIADIKADMMKPVPMNRLLCGDVGFGKTEVALRAAFKAVVGGKQVAILVPTTILALQHYQTAVSRMRGYAVNIDMISRLRKPKERKEILNRARRGDIDILIGTHALLSNQVKFKDLGLLIIDEEQRFGVVQKEKLREMARNVDTLMLSATPIPRTLNMAMSGINDVSVLDEAPGERRPVQTYVLEHDEDMIIDALSREIDRGGQAFYIHNKIDTLPIIADKISTAIPLARVATAHGQMDKEDLEDIWQCLVRGEIDILVCTTIVETGVDLPNANTLIIENADHFGLSQLHQIRGRVGRSERQAYAYFTYRPGRVISEEAEKRLDAVREFAEFGAGFKIAMRDLEIRGAGNILGAEQHGYIESVGYDMYLKLLNEAILEESGKAPKKKIETTVVINVSANIPESYISSSSVRMEMYKKISTIENSMDAADTVDEFLDRFGDIPKPTERLINVALAKAIAETAEISKIEAKDGKLFFISEKPDIPVWAELFAKFPSLSFAAPSSLTVAYRMRAGDDPTEIAVKIMKEYERVKNEE